MTLIAAASPVPTPRSASGTTRASPSSSATIHGFTCPRYSERPIGADRAAKASQIQARDPVGRSLASTHQHSPSEPSPKTMVASVGGSHPSGAQISAQNGGYV